MLLLVVKHGHESTVSVWLDYGAQTVLRYGLRNMGVAPWSKVPQPGSFCSHKKLVAALAWNGVNTVVYRMKRGFSLSQNIPERRPCQYWSDMYPSSLARTVQSLATLEGAKTDWILG